MDWFACMIFPSVIYNSRRNGVPSFPGITVTINRFGFTVCTDGQRFYLLGRVTGWWLFWELGYRKESVKRSSGGMYLKIEGSLSFTNATLTIPVSDENVAWNRLSN